jgi:hypothetical protein
VTVTGVIPGDVIITVTVDGIEGTADGEVTGPGVLATFTASDGTNLNGHVVDTGQTVIVYSGTWETQGGRARQTSAGLDVSAAIPCGSPDGRYEVDIPVISAQNGTLKTDITVRQSSAIDYIQFGPKSFDLNTAQVWKRENDNWTMLAEAAFAFPAGGRFGATLDGNTLDFDVDGVPVITGVIEPFNATAEHCGWACHKQAEYDNATFELIP